jgi:eukaryotic-like serine/threonine-protein kinase
MTTSRIQTLFDTFRQFVASFVRSLSDRAGSSSSSSAMLGPYTLGPKIGQGGMGEVYRARHSLMDRDVAIKVLPFELADAEGRLRFEREVQVTGRLESPNTVAIHDYGCTPDGRAYYVMELVEGYDLDRLVTELGPVSPGRAVHLLKQICAALDEAHAVGLVHRDIKPANIALCERAGRQDVVKVLDFGLAEELGKASNPRPAALVGTPAYIAPESILAPESIDARTDLYSVGAVAYWLLTGTPVFDGSSVVEICSQHIHSVPEAPSARLGRALPADLEAVILRCLAKDPAERFASTRLLAEALDRCDCAGEATAGAPAFARGTRLRAVPPGRSSSRALSGRRRNLRSSLRVVRPELWEPRLQRPEPCLRQA